MDKLFYQGNRKRFMRKTETDGLTLLFGSSAPYKNEKGYYGKRLDMNFFYMTGIEKTSFILAMWMENGRKCERLFADKRNPFEEKWTGRRLAVETIKSITGVEDIDYLSSFDEFLNDMLNSDSIRLLNLDIPSWHNDDVPAPIQTFIDRVNDSFHSVKINNIKTIIDDMRMVKQEEEIDCIKKGIVNAKLGIDAMLRNVKPGMYEYELQAIANNSLYATGEMPSTPMVASGGNAVILHYPDSTAQISEKDLILIDFCPRSSYYASDISRAFPSTGKFTKRQKDIYNVALDANIKMIDAVKPGMSFKKMNELCNQFLSKGMMSIGLIDSPDEVGKYYYHNVSHYIGLDIHDVGNIDIPIQHNTVLTIDAGVYVAEENIGLRVEDNVLISDDGSVNLSSSIIKEVSDIEEFMK